MKKLLLPLLGGLFACALTASALPLLTLTEVSNTQLNYSWNTGQSGLITATSADHFSLNMAIPYTPFTTPDFAVGNWIEPDAPLRYNQVYVSATFTNRLQIIVISDTGPQANEGTYDNGDTLTSTAGTFAVVFNDAMDTVPEPSVLGLAGMCLLFAASKRFRR